MRNGSAGSIEDSCYMRAVIGCCIITNRQCHARANLLLVNNITYTGITVRGVAIIAHYWHPIRGDTTSNSLAACERESKPAVFRAKMAGDFDDILIGLPPKSEICFCNYSRQTEKCR